MNVESLMTREPDCCSPDESIRSAAVKMQAGGIGMLPVVEDDEPVGVITDRDVCMAVAAGLETTTPIAQIMSQPAVCCTRTDKPRSVLDTMREKHVRRLVVTDERGAVCGILALDDLAAEAKERVFEHVPSHSDVVETLRSVSRYRSLQVGGSVAH
jgi:CBS domain-containing protein